MTLHRINLPELGLPVGPYTHVVVHNETLYTSGFTAFGSSAQSGTISEQARVIFEQLKTIALSQNTSMDNLVKVTIFVSRLDDMVALRETLIELYNGHIPASSLIKVDRLFSPDLLIEIEGVFAK